MTMNLSRYTLKNINSDKVVVPADELFDLPEKVLQFGTGGVLRGLPDYFIDEANRQGIFNGRIVAVKSLPTDLSVYDRQDCLYTLCVHGVQNGEKVEENIINSSISRVLCATEQWAEVLKCAHNPQIQIIISNTSEAGIQLVNDDAQNHPPKSYPGRLLAFLYERFKAFGGSQESGMVIVPIELVPDNGQRLESIVFELAHLNGLEDEFISWLENHNCFCNSLVDRIVPANTNETLQAISNELGYSDQLIVVTEAYRLWAIEGNEHVKNVLSFAQADDGIVIQSNIDIYRELKLRLLNGTHTLSCGLAFLAGFETVQQSMNDEALSSFITNLMQQEIAPHIHYNIAPEVADDFSKTVLNRFRNPYLQHQWYDITLNYSLKMKLRCIPVLLNHYSQHNTVPEHMALGFAAYIYFMKPVSKQNGLYYGQLNGESYLIKDDWAGEFHKRWIALSQSELVRVVLKDFTFWGEDLTLLPGFKNAVLEKLNLMMDQGIKEAIANLPSKKKVAA